jgi:hypothetical protein
VIANAASAEFGRGGTQIVIVTRPGTNQLHGSLFAYNRNAALSAKNFFATGPKPKYNRNEYGGSLGGPIVRNKLFYFGSFEGLKRIGSTPVVSAMPTPALKGGDFSGLAAIRDPLTGETFAGNRIPSGRISPFAREMLKFAADPNTPTTAAAGLGNNYTWNTPIRETNDRYSIRLDHHLSDKDRINGRYWQANNGPFQNGGSGDATELFGNFPGWGAATKSAMASYTRTLTPSVINEARFAFMHNNFFRTPQNSDLDPSRFVPGLTPPLPGLGGLPNVVINGFRSFIDLAGSGDRQRNWEFYDNVSWIRGSHNLKAGMEWQRASSRNLSNFAPSRGQFRFDGRYTGNAFADFLLGYPFQTTLPTQNPIVEPQNSRWAGFLQDDWTATSKLTLNLGVRYEYAGLFENSIGELANFDPSLGKLVLISGKPDPAFASLPIVQGSEIGLTPKNYVNKDRNNFAPRVGFAYRPFGGTSFVIRSAYGIFYNVNAGYINAGFAQNPPFRTSLVYDALPGATPSLTMANPFPGSGSIPAAPTVNAFDRNRVNSYMQQWNFTLEGEVLPNTAIRATYLGNRGSHLDRLININEPDPAPGVVQLRRPYQPFGNILYRESGRNSLFNSLQLGAIRRLSNGLSFQIEYQLANALGEQPHSLTTPMNNRNARLDWGHADFIRRHVLTANYTYDLPFGKGRAVELSGFANTLFGGWRLNGIVGKGSGEPFSVNFNSTVVGWPSNRADLVGDPYAGARTLNRWFNPDAFAVPAPFTFGNSPRNVLWGPGYFTWDSSLMKNTALTERLNLEIRAEFFNVLNHPTFGLPAANISVPTQVGRITSTLGPPRDVQFGARLSF